MVSVWARFGPILVLVRLRLLDPVWARLILFPFRTRFVLGFGPVLVSDLARFGLSLARFGLFLDLFNGPVSVSFLSCSGPFRFRARFMPQLFYI